MNLNGVSVLKRRLIFQALDTWHDCKQNTDKYLTAMIEFGWSDSNLHNRYGSYKTCIWKNSIIAKYVKPDNCYGEEAHKEIKREFEQYHAVPYKLRKYFARSYILENGLLIQDRVLVECSDKHNCTKDINKIFNNKLGDHVANHGHSKKGTIKFFDWVYKRIHPWFGNFNMPLTEGPE
ncbi:MAG: hypothetical protein ACXAC5_04760 [Promethearchaeota archaeon]|jgi:hypothetical protein